MSGSTKPDLSEARRELQSDLRHASNEEDIRDTQEEYRQEVADARRDYVKNMRKRGYTVGEVQLESEQYSGR